MALRGFQIVSKYKGKGIQLPRRSTEYSAGYDIRAAKTVKLPARSGVIQIPTGIKAYMQPDEFLLLANRSSNPYKRNLVMANGVGIDDQDYYNNPSNEGELFASFINIGNRPYVIHKGDRIMQGIFRKYLLTDDDHPKQQRRQGGFGSTGKK